MNTRNSSSLIIWTLNCSIILKTDWKLLFLLQGAKIRRNDWRYFTSLIKSQFKSVDKATDLLDATCAKCANSSISSLGWVLCGVKMFFPCQPRFSLGFGFLPNPNPNPQPNIRKLNHTFFFPLLPSLMFSFLVISYQQRERERDGQMLVDAI